MRVNRGRAKLLAKVEAKLREYAKDEVDIIDQYAAKNDKGKWIVDDKGNAKLADVTKVAELNELLDELANESIVIKGHEYSKRFIDFLEYLAEAEDEFTSEEIVLVDNILEQFEESKGE
ncbi:phage protein [Streptococcus equi subsp. equi]|nr:phage protein [Streptococcus equi subsp. equi]CRT73441.1 phage protein [Streptococcus equi subsp. equi]CRT74192.1 phage protein [Streptococcus equi subsp. equi]CRT75154.1 phage protein [Streptococcus equi subsp. equi]CRT86541.1 phage protein [Streptococcus equi subsp. equi]